MLIKRLVLMLVIVSTLIMTGCSGSSYLLLGSIETNTSTSYSMSYTKFKGNKSKTIKLKEPRKIDVEISTKSGSLTFTITNEDGDILYTEENIPTKTFSVDADTAGKYVISVKADDHKGSFKISWAKSLE